MAEAKKPAAKKKAAPKKAAASKAKKPAAKKAAPKKAAPKKAAASKTAAKKVSEKKPSAAAMNARIRIRIKAYDHKVIDQSADQIVQAAQRSGAKVSGPVPLPTERHRETVIRSPFVHKDSREQYEMRIHKRLIDIVEPTPKTIETLSSLNLPSGVDIEIKM